jgi:hypothetical protein
MSSTPSSAASSPTHPDPEAPLSPSLISSRLGLNAFMYIRYLFPSNPPSRGFQLAIVGAYRGLQNPDLYPTYENDFANCSFTQAHYRQAGYAVGAGLLLYLLLLFPLFLIRASVWTSSLFIDLKKTKWDDDLIDGGIIPVRGF